MNDCKGLEDNVKSLNDRVGYLEKNLDEMRALVNVLNQNVEGEFDCIENKYRSDALNFEVNSNPLRVVKKTICQKSIPNLRPETRTMLGKIGSGFYVKSYQFKPHTPVA